MQAGKMMPTRALICDLNPSAMIVQRVTVCVYFYQVVILPLLITITVFLC